MSSVRARLLVAMLTVVAAVVAWTVVGLLLAGRL